MMVEHSNRGPGRPFAATREDVEHVALGLMLSDGYENVSVEAIVAAAGIGRTTFFRYFGSKPGVIWTAFDETIARLDASIQAADRNDDPLDIVRAGIVSSTRLAVQSSDVWLERFVLLDTNPALRAGAYEHWEDWKRVIAAYIASLIGASQIDVVPTAIASACQGVFLAELRSWHNSNEDDEDRANLLKRLDDDLAMVCAVLRPLLFPQPLTGDGGAG